MGHVIVSNGEYHGCFSDHDLWTLRHFFLLAAAQIEANENTDEAKAVSRFLAAWDWQGPGVLVGAGMDDLSVFGARIADLIRAYSRARDIIAAFGEVIPLEYLESNVRTPNAWYLSPQPTRRFSSEVERLIDVARRQPNKAPEPTTTSVMPAAEQPSRRP